MGKRVKKGKKQAKETKKHKANEQQVALPGHFTDPYCAECNDGGSDLVLCETCPLVFHISCLKTAFEDLYMPLNVDPWYCPVCSFRTKYGVKQLYVYLTQRFEDELLNTKSALFWVLLLFRTSESPLKITKFAIPEDFQTPKMYMVTLKYYGFYTSEESYENKREDEFYVSQHFHFKFFLEVLTAALKERVIPKVKSLKLKGPILSTDTEKKDNCGAS